MYETFKVFDLRTKKTFLESDSRTHWNYIQIKTEAYTLWVCFVSLCQCVCCLVRFLPTVDLLLFQQAARLTDYRLLQKNTVRLGARALEAGEQQARTMLSWAR